MPKQSRCWLKSLNIIYLYPTRCYPIMLFVESRFQNETQFHAWSMARPTFVLNALRIPACPSFWYYCCVVFFFFIFKLATCSKLGDREYRGESGVHYKSHQQEEAKERKGIGEHRPQIIPCNISFGVHWPYQIWWQRVFWFLMFTP